MKKYFKNLEGARGYMSIWVFVTHFVTMASLPFERNEGWGHLLADGNHAVFVFILMSGFVIQRLLRKEETYFNYIARRAFRLFPIYLVALFISILMLDFYREVLLSNPWDNVKNFIRLEQIDQTYQFYSLNILSHIFLLHGLFPNQIFHFTYSPMGQSWSLTLEWQFYLVAPILHNLVCSKFGRKKSMIIVFLLILSIVIAKLLKTQLSFLPNTIILFTLGYYTSILVDDFFSERKSNLYFLLFIIVGITFFLNGFFGALAFAIWSTIIYSEVQNSKFLNLLFANRLAIFFGRISYSFYCLHMIFIITSSWFLISVLGIKVHYQYSFWLLILSFGLTTFASYLAYRFIEVPAINYAKRAFKS